MLLNDYAKHFCAIATLLAISACSQNQAESAISAAIEGSETFAAPVVILLPDEERRQWQSLSRQGRTLGSLEIVNGCGDGRGNINPILPRVRQEQSAQGSRELDQLAYDVLLGMGFFEHPSLRFSGAHEARTFRCQLNAAAMDAWLNAHPQFVVEEFTEQLTLGQRVSRAIILSARSNISIGQVQSYEAEVPMQGRRPFASAEFTYELTSNVEGFAWDGHGTGFAKIYQDADSEQWEVVEFRIEDPRLIRSAIALGAERTAAEQTPVAQSGLEANRGFAYSVVRAQAQPFIYIEDCSGSEGALGSLTSDAVSGLPTLMESRGLTSTGPITALWNTRCLQVGYPYSGRAPSVLLIGKTGQLPGGVLLRVDHLGSDQDVIEVYRRMNDLLAQAGIDNSAWTTFEVYRDTPTRAGGARRREIYYVTQGDISRLTNLAPPTEASGDRR